MDEFIKLLQERIQAAERDAIMRRMNKARFAIKLVPDGWLIYDRATKISVLTLTTTPQRRVAFSAPKIQAKRLETINRKYVAYIKAK